MVLHAEAFWINEEKARTKDRIKDEEEEYANQGEDQNEEDNSATQCEELKKMKMMMKEGKNENLREFNDFLIPY